MRYKDKEEIAKWLKQVEEGEVEGKKLRSEIERLLEEKNPVVFSPDAFYETARYRLHPEELNALRNFWVDYMSNLIP